MCIRDRDRSGYGLYYPEENQLFIEHYFDDWNMVGDDSLVFVMENGTVSTDAFTLEDDKLNLTDKMCIRDSFTTMELHMVYKHYFS